MSSIIEWLFNTPPGDLAGHDWSFEFTSGHNNYVRLILFALLAALIWLTYHCYRKEGVAFKKLRVFLTCVRATVIALVLMILFQPAIVLEIRDTLYSSVVFLVDDSISMSFKDRYMEKSQDEFRQQLSKRFEIDESQLEAMSRKEILAKSLASGMVDKLRKDHPVEIVKFSTDSPIAESGGYISSLGNLARFEDDEEVSGEKELDLMLAKLNSSGFETDYSLALRELLERYQGKRVGAIVVAGDGRATLEGANPRLDAAVAYAKQRGVPLYSVLVGDPIPPVNLSLLGLRMPREVRAGSVIDVIATVGYQNITKDNEIVKVRLYSRSESEKWPEDMANAKLIEEQEIKIARDKKEAEAEAAGSNGIKEVNFQVETSAMKTGEHVYRAVIVPKKEELTDKDNQTDAFVSVSERQLRVLLVSADAGWEFQNLRNFLLRQPELYRVSIWQQNADSSINQSASTGMKLTRLPRTLSEMIDSGVKANTGIPPGYHVIILYDPTPTVGGFDKNFIALLKKYVTVHSGGLCYIASNKNTDEVMTDLAAKPLHDLLPVVVDRNRIDISSLSSKSSSRSHMGFPVRLTTYGMDHPLTRMAGNSRANTEIWDMMPGVFWSHAVRETKSNVRVLAVTSDPNKTMGEDRPVPVIVTHTPGKGRVVYMGFDETWRWRQFDKGSYYRRFWGNMLSYLATKSDRRVVINTGGDRFRIGDKVTLMVEAFNKDYSPLETDTFVIKSVEVDTKKTTEYTLKKDRPGLYTITIDAEKIGRFMLTCQPDFAPENKVDAKQIIVEMPEAEAREPEADPWTMQRLVSKNEHCLDVMQMDELAELIPPGRLGTLEKRIYTLWDTKMMLILLMMLLTVEWFLRKRANLT